MRVGMAVVSGELAKKRKLAEHLRAAAPLALELKLTVGGNGVLEFADVLKAVADQLSDSLGPQAEEDKPLKDTVRHPLYRY